MMSSGKIATPPQPIGSPQPTNVSPATDGGAAKPSPHTGKPASTTAMQPCGIASIAVRVEIGDDQDSGVARSSRAGTKRRVKAGPTSRGCPGRSGREPRIQTFRSPFLRRTVVMVAVDTRERVLIASGVRDIERETPVEFERIRTSCGARASRQVAPRAYGRTGGAASRDHHVLSRICGLIY